MLCSVATFRETAVALVSTLNDSRSLFSFGCSDPLFGRRDDRSVAGEICAIEPTILSNVQAFRYVLTSLQGRHLEFSTGAKCCVCAEANCRLGAAIAVDRSPNEPPAARAEALGS